MEEISGTKSHKLILNNRRTGSFTGILDVLSFDVGEILLETELGMLDLKGKDLHVNRLNLEKGEDRHDYVFEGTGGDRKER